MHPSLGESAGSIRAIAELSGPSDESVALRMDSHVAACAEEFLAQKDKMNGQPLFMTVGFLAPHSPIAALAERVADAQTRLRASGHDPIPFDPNQVHPWFADKRQQEGLDYLLAPTRLEIIRATCAAMIEHLDECVARILTAAQGLPGRTVVIYTSDHGDCAGDHGWLTKKVFYEPAVRVPLVCSELPDRSAGPRIRAEKPNGRGVVIDGAPVSLLDIAPTLCRLTGAPSLPLQAGIDLTSAIRTGSTCDLPQDRIVFSDLMLPHDTPIRMVRWGRFKLVIYHGYPAGELYDLALDPNERVNLVGVEEYREVERELAEVAHEGWCPEVIRRTSERKLTDLDFLTRWGLKVGMGQGEIWDASPPPPGEFPPPLSSYRISGAT